MALANLEKALLFLVLLFLPTQLGKHFWPQFSYVYSLPIDYLSPTLYFWDILVLSLFIIKVINGIKNINQLALNLFLIFLLSQSLSLLPTVFFSKAGLGPGLIRVEQYLIAGMLGVYLASTNLNKVKAVIFWALGIAILGESLLAVAQFLKGGTVGLWILGERTFSISTPAIAKFDFYGREFLRPYATFPHPNVLAAFMVIITILLSFWGAKRPQNHESVDSGPASQGEQARMTLLVMASFFSGIATVLTVSRAAILAGIFSALILLNKKWKLVFLVVLIILLPVLYTRFSATFNFDNLSLIRREQLSEVAIEIFRQSPVFGVGLNNFIPAAADQLLVGPSRFLQPVHNIFLLALAETGIIGLMGLIGLISYPILRLLKLRTTNYQLRTLLLLWGVIIFLGIFDHYFLTLPQGYRLLFLIWGLSMSMVKY